MEDPFQGSLRLLQLPSAVLYRLEEVVHRRLRMVGHWSSRAFARICKGRSLDLSKTFPGYLLKNDFVRKLYPLIF